MTVVQAANEPETSCLLREIQQQLLQLHEDDSLEPILAETVPPIHHRTPISKS